MTRTPPTRRTIAAGSAVVLVAVLVLVLPPASGATTEGLSFEKGADFAQAENLGWVSNFTLGDGNASFNLTLHGLPGGTITVDDMVTANRTSEEGFRVNVTDALDGEASVTIRFWNGTTPPTSDADANVCAVVDTSAAGMANGTCTAQHVHLQYVITTPDGAASISSFAFQLAGVTSEEPVGSGGTTGGGGGGSPAASQASDEARSSSPPEGASHSYVAFSRSLAEGGQLTVTFPEAEERLQGLTLVVDRPCRSVRVQVDRYPELPAHAEPPDPAGSRALDFVDLQVDCGREPIGDGLRSATLGLGVASQEFADDEQPLQVHALRTGSPVWLVAGSAGAGGAAGEPALLEAGLREPGIVALVVDRQPPELTASVVDAPDREGDLTVVVEAADNVGLGHLSVFVDGHKHETRAGSPFRVTITSADVGQGPVTVRALAEDVSGLVSRASTSATLVPDTTPPRVDARLEGPDADGRLVVRADVQDDGFVERVEFRLNGGRFATVVAPPFDARLNVGGLAGGSHAVQVLAYDAAGNVGKVERRFEVAAGETPDQSGLDEEERWVALWPAVAVAALGVGALLGRERRER